MCLYVRAAAEAGAYTGVHRQRKAVCRQGNLFMAAATVGRLGTVTSQTRRIKVHSGLSTIQNGSDGYVALIYFFYSPGLIPSFDNHSDLKTLSFY